MNAELVKAIVVLPGTALVCIPGALLWFAARTSADMTPAEVTGTRLWIGLVMAVWTVRLFLTVVKGTPAPWAPPLCQADAIDEGG